MRKLHSFRSDKLQRFARAMYYGKAGVCAIRRGVPIGDYLNLLLPPRFRCSTSLPHALYLEFSNICNTSCVYCPCPTYDHRTPYMTEPVLSRIVFNLEKLPVNVIHIGGGEPTLHPMFFEFATAIRKHARFLNIVTNGQWRDESLVQFLGTGIFDRVEVSIDAGEKEDYEASRPGGDFGLLVQNIRQLQNAKKQSGTRLLFSIRLMIRPSMQPETQKYLRYWSSFCDTVIVQYVAKQRNMAYSEDVFVSQTEQAHAYPHCSYPSRALQIQTDGSVPLCCIMGHALDGPVQLGNIMRNNLHELWEHPLLIQYRQAHIHRRAENMPLCIGCLGA